MSVIREVYSANDGEKEQYSVTRPDSTTTFEQVNDLLDRLMGPSEYHGVYLLNRAAEHCSDVAICAATMPDGAQTCSDYAEASLFLQRHADSLDAYLVESYLKEAQ